MSRSAHTLFGRTGKLCRLQGASVDLHPDLPPQLWQLRRPAFADIASNTPCVLRIRSPLL